jgi:hypothetical protein
MRLCCCIALWCGIPGLGAAAQTASVPKAVDHPALAFDAETKLYNAKPGEMTASFSFHLTNVWTNAIRIDRVHSSCGCATAKLPQTPWGLPAGGGGEVTVQVNLADKPSGLLTKNLTFFTSVGKRVVYLKIHIPPPDLGLSSLESETRHAAIR